jgi:DNA/RNA-binding domain of Phe-tRNA-synthetase-like protein
MLIEDLKETFENLNKWKWKLNPNKCVFGVPSGQLLRFLVSNQGIEASTKQIRAIIEMEPPRGVKDVQKVTGSMQSLIASSHARRKRTPFLQAINEDRQV